jgi:competence protein ComEC
MRAVAVIPAAGLLAGSAAGLLVPEFPSIPGYVAVAAALAWTVWSWQASRQWSIAAAVALTFFLGGALLAADAWHKAWRPPLRLHFEELASERRREAEALGQVLPEDNSVFAVLTGTLRADASARPNGAALSLDIQSVSVRGAGRVKALESAATKGPEGSSSPEARTDIPARGGILLTVAGTLAAERLDEWRAGRTIRLPAELRRPSRYLNPGVADDERALARRGTTLVGSVKSGTLVDVVAKGGRLSEAAADTRAFVRRAIASAVGRWSARSAAIVTAIVIGDRAGLDDGLERRLQEAGTYHVIAISGGNIAILAGLTLVGFRIAGLLGRAAMLTAIAGLVAYCYVIGGTASVNRATLMAIVYFAARAMDLRGPPVNALALVAGLLVAMQPLAVADAGFLLTFGATAAIILVAPLAPLRTLPRLVAPFAAMLAASVAAEAALLPIAAFLFSRVTVAGLVLNFAAIPLMAVAQIAGMALVPAVAVPPLAAALGWIAHAGAEGLVRSADLVEVVPMLTWRVSPPSWIALIVYYCGLITAWTLWRLAVQVLGSRESRTLRFVRRGAACAAVLSLLWIVAEPWIARSPAGDGRLHVTFIDVGQGDAALVRFPNGSTLLVDAGGLPGASSFDVGDRVVAPVLRHGGIRTLDLVALTHGDVDHIGGADAMLTEFRPHDVWEGIPVPPHEPLRALQRTAERVGATWTNVQTNDLATIDGVQILMRHPAIADWQRQDVRNDDSIVLEIIWRDVSIVLTGDIGKEAERTITPLFSPSPLRIVKVPHHGSLTSSTVDFIRALSPRVAVVSVGRSNTFGHPAPEIIDRYRRAGADLFRTDQDGAISLDTDGYIVDIRTFTGRRTFLKKQIPSRSQEGQEEASATKTDRDTKHTDKTISAAKRGTHEKTQ